MIVLIACEFSGGVRDAFIAASHDAMSCDLLTPEKMAAAKRMWDEGLTTNAIAKQIGVSRPTISRLLSGKTWGQK